MPTRFFTGNPEDWPPIAGMLADKFKDRTLVTPFWLGFPPQVSFSMKEIAGPLRCSEDTVARMIEEGHFEEVITVGASPRVLWIAIWHWLAKQQGIMN